MAWLMINRLIELSLKNRFIVVALYLGLAGWGWWALGATPIDAIPDLSDNQVIVFTDWPGHSPQEVEDQVTLSADGEPAGPRRRARRPLAVGVRLLDDLRRLRGQRRSVLRAHPRARAHESGREEPARRRRADARARRDRCRARLLVHARKPHAVSARPAHAAGLVHPLSAQRRPWRRRGRVGRRLRSAIPDRRRSESPRGRTTCRSARWSPRSATAT